MALGLEPFYLPICSYPKDWLRLDDLLRGFPESVLLFMLQVHINISLFFCNGQTWCQWLLNCCPLPLTYVLYLYHWLTPLPISGQMKVPSPRPETVYYPMHIQLEDAPEIINPIHNETEHTPVKSNRPGAWFWGLSWQNGRSNQSWLKILRPREWIRTKVFKEQKGSMLET